MSAGLHVAKHGKLCGAKVWGLPRVPFAERQPARRILCIRNKAKKGKNHEKTE